MADDCIFKTLNGRIRTFHWNTFIVIEKKHNRIMTSSYLKVLAKHHCAKYSHKNDSKGKPEYPKGKDK